MARANVIGTLNEIENKDQSWKVGGQSTFKVKLFSSKRGPEVILYITS